MANTSSLSKLLPILFIILVSLIPQCHSITEADECGYETTDACNNKAKATPLKIIAIVSILITSIIGVSLPLITRAVPAFHPDRDLFAIVKCFAGGIILGTGFMHVLPDSFDMLSSSCLPDKPWHKFPFTGFISMLSAIVTMMVDSMAISTYSGRGKGGVNPDNTEGVVAVVGDHEMAAASGHGHFHAHNHQVKEGSDTQLSHFKVVAMVLELGIIVHSVVIGLSLGASNNTCTIKGLVAALCFHQMFEGMGLGGCILHAEYKPTKKVIMVFFSVTTPFGIAIGMAVSHTYKENSPRALATVGLLNASSSGLLIYMALVDLLSAEFMGSKLQRSVKLQIKSYMAVFLGAGCISVG